MEKDRRGRRRQPNQERGLRPLFPHLPEQWSSRAVRVAMSSADWARFDDLVREATPATPTQARAHGVVISDLIQQAQTIRSDRPTPGPSDWMDWERQKTLRLLRSAV